MIVIFIAYDPSVKDQDSVRNILHLPVFLMQNKTIFLGERLCKQKKKVIYFPNEHIHFLSDPSFLHFFKDHKKSIIIIEDAEEILTSRELSLSNRGISNLLNLTDGLMGGRGSRACSYPHFI